MSMLVLVDGREEKGGCQAACIFYKTIRPERACAGEDQCLPGLFMDVWKRETWLIVGWAVVGGMRRIKTQMTTADIYPSLSARLPSKSPQETTTLHETNNTN